MLANLLVFFASSSWGVVSDRIGRRWAMMLPALVSVALTPMYLLSANTTVIVGGFILQGLFAGGGMYGQVPSYLNERFPTEIRATATAFCYHIGAIFGGLVPPLLTYFAITWDLGFAIPMLIGTMFGLVNFILVSRLRPGDKGRRNGPGSGRGLERKPVR